MTITTEAVILAVPPLPAGAVKVFDWEHPNFTGLPEPVRYFDGTRRVVERGGRRNDIEIVVEGTQYWDGRVERAIRVRDVHGDHELTIERARELSSKLDDAVEEAWQMANYDAPTPSAALSALLTAHDHVIDAHAHAALAAGASPGLGDARTTHAMQLVDQLHQAANSLGKLIDVLNDRAAVGRNRNRRGPASGAGARLQCSPHTAAGAARTWQAVTYRPHRGVFRAYL
jgi:hypothetical protein